MDVQHAAPRRVNIGRGNQLGMPPTVRALACNHSTVFGKRHWRRLRSSGSTLFHDGLLLGGMRGPALRSFEGCSRRDAAFQTHPRDRPSPLKRAKTGLYVQSFGAQAVDALDGQQGSGTGDCGNARTEYAAASRAGLALC